MIYTGPRRDDTVGRITNSYRTGCKYFKTINMKIGLHTNKTRNLTIHAVFSDT